MKFSCEKSAFLDAISISSRAVSNKSTIAILEGLRLTASDTLTLAGYDLSMGIRTTVDADVIEPGEIVLSAKLLGDIVISMERAMEQAELYGHSLQREVAYLTVHSMLHLLGYDHEAGGLEAVRRREKEEAVLIQLGLPRTVSYTSDEI